MLIFLYVDKFIRYNIKKKKHYMVDKTIFMKVYKESRNHFKSFIIIQEKYFIIKWELTFNGAVFTKISYWSYKKYLVVFFYKFLADIKEYCKNTNYVYITSSGRASCGVGREFYEIVCFFCLFHVRLLVYFLLCITDDFNCGMGLFYFCFCEIV